MDSKVRQQSTNNFRVGAIDPVGATSRSSVSVVHNHSLSRFEGYMDGLLVGYVRYSMVGAEIWLLQLHVARFPGTNNISPQLIRMVLDDAGGRRIAVHPYCPQVRAFIRDNPTYLHLVPSEWRSRFKLPTENPVATPSAAHGKLPRISLRSKAAGGTVNLVP